MNSFPVIVLSVIIFAALAINLALKPAYSARLTSTLIMITIIGGSIIYGFGFTSITGDVAISLVRTPFSVMGMFLGKNDLGAIANAPIVTSPVGIFLFWLLHFLAFYSMASAAIVTVGAEGLRRLRLFLALSGDLTIIYGITPDSILVGKECAERKETAVVFIDEADSAGLVPEIINMGMAVVTGSGAASCDKLTMTKLRVRSRKRIEVYALHPERSRNLFFALALKEAFKNAQIDPDKTSIALPGTEDIAAAILQVSTEEYGFGYVQVFSVADLAARAMIRLCPPWDFLTFDKEGRAEQDFDCIVIGFGDTGQAALRYLIMNGQFVGSTFHAAVFSTNMQNEAGFLLTECPEIVRHYDIDFYQKDGRSREFYEYLEKRLDTLKYIAVCSGNSEMNTELTDNLLLYLKRKRSEHICVIQVTAGGVSYQETVESDIKRKKVFTLDMLSAEKADRAGILLNATYDSSDRSNWEKWVACDSFSKMSSRASAEFIPALVKASGYSEEEIMQDGWNPGEAKLRVLGETEHLRWCAFHYTMGYRTMTDQEFDRRAEEYKEHVRSGKPGRYRIAKDTENRIHACLIPNDALDELSAKESRVTGKEVDYRKSDINNVLAIPQILKKQKEEI